MESLWLLIVLFFILLLICPQVFKFYVSYSPLENTGLVVLKLWFINIKYFSFKFQTSGIIIRTRKQRKQMEYEFNDPTIKFYENFTLQIRQKMKIKYVDLYSNIGTGDAKESAILGGCLNIVYSILGQYIKMQKPTCTVIINSHTAFNEKVSDFSFLGKLSIALFDFIYCLVIAYLEKDK